MRLIPTIHPRVAGALVLAVTVLAVAGCGDSSSDGEPTTATSGQRADFIAAADRLCTDAGTEIDAAVQKRLANLGAKSPSSAQVRAIFTDITLPALERLYDRIGQLDAPADDAEEVDAILAEAEAAIGEAEADPGSLAVPDGGVTPFDEVNRLQQNYGFEVCGAPNE